MKKDFFSNSTFIDADEELIIKKKAVINARYTIPFLEAHNKSKQLSNKAFGIGRDKKNAVIISDPLVSKLHATVIFRKGKACIQDLKSKNGTFINGERIPAGKEIVLKNKDEIIVGNTKLIYYT